MTDTKPVRFTLTELGRLQLISNSIDCECPNHLAELVQSLGAFERYAADCENRNAEDARVHAMLYEMTAKARTIMEDALIAVCEHENIDIGVGSSEKAV